MIVYKKAYLGFIPTSVERGGDIPLVIPAQRNMGLNGINLDCECSDL